MAYSINSLAGWKNRFMTQSVQNNNKTYGSDFLSSESTVMFAGPAELYTDLSRLVPIGLVQNVQVSQQKQIQQLFELGSRKPFFVPGRTIVSGGIARILFDGPSLMYAMYLSGDDSASTDAFDSYINPGKNDTWKPINALADADKPTSPLSKDNVLGGTTKGTFKTSSSEPTPGYFFINLASSFFNRPTGLGFVLYDMEGQPYGGFYMENCYIQAHTFSVASQQTVLVENVSFRASTMVPLDKDILETTAKDGAVAGGAQP
jgi:hypothetical protein